MQKTVRFTKPDKANFFATLRERVNGYFRENNISKHADWRMYLKTVAMLTMYLAPFALILTGLLPVWAVLMLYVVMGLGVVGIGMSIMHDAIHGAYTSNTVINKILGYSINLIGGNDFNWKVQHNLLHHTYTNVYGLDEDIEDKPILRLSPSGKLLKVHYFQHLYAPFLYMLATASWVFLKDFKQMIRYNKTGTIEKLGHSAAVEFTVLVLFKAFYWAVFFALPLYLLAGVYGAGFLILGFFMMHFTSGLVMTLVFQLAHVVESTEHPVPDDSGNIENVWAIHQLETTANFARKNKLISWYVGGLNFQVEHHLFPHICHVHYPVVAEIVKSTAEEFGVDYKEYETFGEALHSHFSTLKKLGRNELEPTYAKTEPVTEEVDS